MRHETEKRWGDKMQDKKNVETRHKKKKLGDKMQDKKNGEQT